MDRDVKALESVSIFGQPRVYDYNGEHGWDFGTAWWFWEASRCDKCGALVVSTGAGECEHSQAMEELDGTAIPVDEYRRGLTCSGRVSAIGPEAPWFYPIDLSIPTADREGGNRRLYGLVKLIAHLSVCLVQVDGSYGLAATTRSLHKWEVVEAYVRLGFLPPVELCLPHTIYRDYTEYDYFVNAACQESLRLAVNDLNHRLRAMDRVSQNEAATAQEKAAESGNNLDNSIV